MIALPLLGFYLPLKTIVPLLILLAIFISLYLSIQLRKSIRTKHIRMLFLATLPGVPLGVVLLKYIPAQGLSIFLGLLMIAFTTFQLVVKPQPRHLGTPWTLLTGFITGFLGGSIGIGAPPIIIYTAMQPWSKDETKATIAFLFLILGSFIAVNHAISGLITSEVLHYFVISLPALAAGIGLGVFTYKHISDHGYRKLTFILVLLLGVMMVYRNIF